jgi:hypothetical protein
VMRITPLSIACPSLAAEITGCVNLAAWPERSRLASAGNGPIPAVGGHRFTAFLTDTNGGQLAGPGSPAQIELSLAAADLAHLGPRPCASPARSPAASPPRSATASPTSSDAWSGPARRWQLRLDRDWPWATHLGTAFSRLRTAPWPA